jgi:hypothetical protein
MLIRMHRISLKKGLVMKHGRKDYNERIQDAAGIIPEDEPVFLLRGQDATASQFVRSWAVQYLMDNQKSEEAKTVYERVTLHADKMARYAKKKPDIPADQI